jgi:hypothetical protein
VSPWNSGVFPRMAAEFQASSSIEAEVLKARLVDYGRNG